ncbi:hypothetical protein V7O66_07980 [Methanolobus sp. ZRKC3]|uniref:hypothetical protein n=1 Tax=Methanolobus sp. ZRKC3 TaxID=3125786 RepID=UPI003250A343
MILGIICSICREEAYANQFYQDAFKELSGVKETIDGNRIRKLSNQSKCCIKILPLVKDHYAWDKLENVTGFSQRQMRDWMKETEQAEAV